jgi:hypothetical protein
MDFTIEGMQSSRVISQSILFPELYLLSSSIISIRLQNHSTKEDRKLMKRSLW